MISEKQEATDLQKLYESTLKEVKEGEIIKGRIIEVTPKEVVVDVGYKSEGVISKSEFPSPESLKVGDEIEVLLESKEDKNGMIVISKSKADRLKGWDNLVKNFKEGDVISGKVMRKVKGGLIVDIGAEAFLPASLVSLKGFTNLNQLVSQTLNFKIIKMNLPRRNIVLSRREVILKEKEVERDKVLDGLEVGEVRTGVVKNITDFGAFVNIGGADGLLHITDMSWGRISHPSEMLAVGDKVDVVILGFDKQNKRVSLGLKQKTPSPWQGIEEKYLVGSQIKGKVVNILPYGAFIELEKGVEGLVHISELSWTRRINHPSEVLAMGDVIEAVVLGIDKDSQKISLGIKQTEANPWENIETKYPAGTKIKGKVHHLTDYGAFVEVEEGIDGLVHVSDMSWTKRITHPQEFLKKGQKVEAVILSIDTASRKISLGIKQLLPDPWPEIAEKFPAGLILDGVISSITNFGVFVEIEKDIEGLVHISELDKELPPADIEKHYKPGDKVKVRVLKVDPDLRKLSLTLKDVK